MCKEEQTEYILNLIEKNILNKALYDYAEEKVINFSKFKKVYATDNRFAAEHKKKSFSISFEPSCDNVHLIKMISNMCNGNCYEIKQISFYENLIKVKESNVSKIVTDKGIPFAYQKESSEKIYLNNDLIYKNKLKFIVCDNVIDNKSESSVEELFVIENRLAIESYTGTYEDKENLSRNYHLMSTDFEESNYNNRVEKRKSLYYYSMSSITKNKFDELKENAIINKSKTLKK